MKALVYKGQGHLPNIVETADLHPDNNQILIKVQNVAINHTELWFMKENKLQFPNGLILGADGAGVVEKVGNNVNPKIIGSNVIINPGLGWGIDTPAQGSLFRILGFPDNGTFAEYVLVPSENVFKMPDHLNYEESAAIGLSGITAYRALFTKAKLKAKERVLITGIGGGTALAALQLAKAIGANVYVTSSSAEKIEKAKKLGAIDGFNYKDAKWSSIAQEQVGGFDVIIDGSGGNQFNILMDLALPGGRIVNFGRTAGNITEIATRLLFWKQLSLFGTSMGTNEEFSSMLSFITKHKIKPIIDAVYPLSKHEEAFNRMEKADQFGKIILQVAQ